MLNLSPEEQIEQIERLAVEIIPKDELLEKLKKAQKEKRPLKIKLGCDPSKPDLHIGHSVPLRQLRLFQDMGHTGILVVGDFTAMIGDPSGKNKTRPQLSYEETRINGETYMKQAYKILEPERTEIRYNSEWLGKLDFADVIKLSGKYTLARMLERDDFEKRYKNEEPISLHEMLYPLAQGYDSVALEADVELGGTDQKFNLLVGRELQRAYGQPDAQAIVTFPLLEGLDGVQKMSKSLDNYIGITDAPKDMFGKTMSIPDELIVKYFRLVTDIDKKQLDEIEKAIGSGENPMKYKKLLGEEIIKMYYDEAASKKARQSFENVFSKGNIPKDIPTAEIPAGEEVWIVNLLRDNDLVKSGGEARRLIKQGAVKIDNEQMKDDKANIKIEGEIILKVGKRRFLKIIAV